MVDTNHSKAGLHYITSLPIEQETPYNGDDKAQENL